MGRPSESRLTLPPMSQGDLSFHYSLYCILRFLISSLYDFVPLDSYEWRLWTHCKFRSKCLIDGSRELTCLLQLCTYSSLLLLLFYYYYFYVYLLLLLILDYRPDYIGKGRFWYSTIARCTKPSVDHPIKFVSY